MELIEMAYIGPGTKPKTIHVKEEEVKPLEDTGMWRISTDADSSEDDGREEE